MVDVKVTEWYILNVCPNNVNKCLLQKWVNKRRIYGNKMFAACLIDTNWEWKSIKIRKKELERKEIKVQQRLTI